MDQSFLVACREAVSLTRAGRAAEATLKAQSVHGRARRYGTYTDERGAYYWMRGELALASGDAAGAATLLQAAAAHLDRLRSVREENISLLVDVYAALGKAHLRTRTFAAAAAALGESIERATVFDGADSWERVLAVTPRHAGALYLAGEGKATRVLDEGLTRTRGRYGNASEQTQDYLSRAHVMLTSLGRTAEAERYRQLSDDAQRPQGDESEIVMAEIDALVGLADVKTRMRQLVALHEVAQMRRAQGLPSPPVSLHLALVGPAGTGKTTLARLVARLYHALGLLPTAGVVSTTGGDLASSLHGRSAQRVNDACDRASGGLLLVNEAYALTSTRDREEGLSALLDRMEDDRGHLAVVVTGYADPMDRFLSANEGLRSRFAAVLEFFPYSTEQLVEIFATLCERYGLHLAPDALTAVEDLATAALASEDPSYGYARSMRTLFEESVRRQAARLTTAGAVITPEHLGQITRADVAG